MPPPRAVVLVSGGLDSAVALHWAMARGHEVVPLTFDYHGRPGREVEAAIALLADARRRGPALPLRRVALPFLREADDLPARPAHLRGAPPGYVPARNLAFYALAASIAEAEGAQLLVGGHNGADPDRFPDASPAFFAEFNALLPRALWSHARSPVQVALPLAGMRKAGVVRLGLSLGAPLGLTWSCYEDGKAPCGACAACAERAAAFAEAGAQDA